MHLIILPIATLILIVALAIAHYRFKRTWATKKGKRDPKYTALTYDPDCLPSWWVRGVLLIFTPILVVVTLIALVPFAPKYWVLTEHNGTIATLSNRFVGGTGDVTNTTYTLTLDGEDTPLVVDDSRVTGLKVGQDVSLTCSLGWVYGGADRANCYLRSF